MTSPAEFVGRFFKHKLLIGGMGVMADDTTFTGDNTVYKGESFAFVLGSQTVLLVAVTGKAEGQRPLLEELIAVVTAMGIMAEGTSTDSQRAVYG
jgi:hypothetical protein